MEYNPKYEKLYVSEYFFGVSYKSSYEMFREMQNQHGLVRKADALEYTE